MTYGTLTAHSNGRNRLLSDTPIKVTIKARRGCLARASGLAARYLDEWLPEDGPRPKQRDCMVAARGEEAYAIWGDATHVRVYQGNL